MFLVVGQLPVPSVLLIEVGLEVPESDRGERLDDGGSLIVLGCARVGDGRAEGSRGLTDEATCLRNEGATRFTKCVPPMRRELRRLQVW